jgi:hypothetical protein
MDYEKIFSMKIPCFFIGIILLYNTLLFTRERYIAEGINGVFDVLMILITGVNFVIIVQYLTKPKEKEKEASILDYEENLLKNSKRKN